MALFSRKKPEKPVVSQRKRELKHAVIDCTGTCNAEIVPAFQNLKIKVYAILVNFPSACSSSWKSGKTPLTGLMSFDAKDTYAISVCPPTFLFETKPSDALVLSLPMPATYAKGFVSYWDEE